LETLLQKTVDMLAHIVWGGAFFVFLTCHEGRIEIACALVKEQGFADFQHIHFRPIYHPVILAHSKKRTQMRCDLLIGWVVKLHQAQGQGVVYKCF
jgi:hypothetical protein